jgi:hypothetical protein
MERRANRAAEVARGARGAQNVAAHDAERARRDAHLHRARVTLDGLVTAHFFAAVFLGLFVARAPERFFFVSIFLFFFFFRLPFSNEKNVEDCVGAAWQYGA